MFKSKVVVSFIMLLCLLFLVFQFNENYWKADVTRALIVPMIALLYIINVKRKSTYFTLFLVAFSISDLITIFSYNIPLDLEYFLGNSLYITAYLALTYEIIGSINMKHILNHFKIHVFILFVLNIYVNYVLIKIENEYVFGLEFSIELIYNVFALILLSVSLLNYFYHDDKKALILFLGSMCIVVSEVIQIAYYYISDKDLLNVSYSMLLIMAFCFYYYQSKMDYDEVLIVT